MGEFDALIAVWPWAFILDCPEHGTHSARPCGAEIGHAIVVLPRNWFWHHNLLQHLRGNGRGIAGVCKNDDFAIPESGP